MDKVALAKLKRTTLQQLAKREGLRANAKNVDIIDLLLEKFPHGVPSPRLQKRNTLEKDIILDLDIAVAVGHARSISPSGFYGSKRVVDDDLSFYSRGDKGGVRSVKQEITRLIDEGISMRETIGDAELLVAHAMSIANEVSKDIREISWIRHCTEIDVVCGLKQDLALWDGTRLMSDADERQQRESLLRDTNQ